MEEGAERERRGEEREERRIEIPDKRSPSPFSTLIK